ncbi:uracil-DNA glycosylase family protein [Alkalimarinus coralli]|uniref:uracil-DNA glycosylase family protein n=1 Tax=Alkalimarinus coralli TaxID=2935863 RepID=UPI00202ACB0D|nr:uracil-DNA glycosylase family protein [Alkalimarinus coralli]
MNKFNALLDQVRACTLCEPYLANGVRPVLQANPKARILLVGQAPGRKVHETGVPFNDPSGDRLRDWLGVTRDVFYNEEVFAIVPMGFCYPGRGKSGDLPPRPECATAWREKLLSHLTNIELTLLVGAYAQDYHLKEKGSTLTKTVSDWRSYWPDIVPLPHPSPRNNIWLSRNPWFEKTLIPELKARVADILATR